MTKLTDLKQNAANIIRTTVRLPERIHQQMTDEIARQRIGKRRKEQPSVDGFIQDAIVSKLARRGDDILADLSLDERAKVEIYVNILRQGKKAKELRVPDDLLDAVLGFIKVLETPEGSVIPRDSITFLKSMMERQK
jgi:hypothetical protein